MFFVLVVVFGLGNGICRRNHKKRILSSLPSYHVFLTFGRVAGQGEQGAGQVAGFYFFTAIVTGASSVSV